MKGKEKDRISSTGRIKKLNSLSMLKKNWVCYLFVLPMLLYVILFSYVPMYGIQLAFKDFRAADGIWGSAWVGLKHFKTFFESYQFGTLLWNTLAISLYSLIAGFPLPILFALVLNYINNGKFKKFSQMVTYAPHFISMVVFCGMITIFLASDGIINQFLMLLGIDPVGFMSDPEKWRHIYVWSGRDWILTLGRSGRESARRITARRKPSPYSAMIPGFTRPPLRNFLRMKAARSARRFL